MIAYARQHGENIYNRNDYVVDTPSDIAKLSKNVEMGSTARVISDGSEYILNSQKVWVKQPSNGGGGGSSSGGEPDIVVLNDIPSSQNNNDIIIL